MYRMKDKITQKKLELVLHRCYEGQNLVKILKLVLHHQRCERYIYNQLRKISKDFSVKVVIFYSKYSLLIILNSREEFLTEIDEC